MSIPAILAVAVLVVGVPLNAYVTVRLWRLSHAAPYVTVLRERTIVSFGVLGVVTLFGLIFVNNDLVPPPLSFDATKLFTRAAMLGLAIVPAAYWLRLYR